jgi:hypothetical protein
MRDLPTADHYGGVRNTNQDGLRNATKNLKGSSIGGKSTFGPKLSANHWVQWFAFWLGRPYPEKTNRSKVGGLRAALTIPPRCVLG